MFKNRVLVVIGVISFLLVTLAVSSPRSHASSTAAFISSDLYQQHPEWWWRTTNQNVGLPLTGSSDDAFPDYYQRHPELNAPVERSVDTTDYFFRHPDINTSSLSVPFSAEQISREYILGERYGTMAESAYLHEYWLGERYGQRP